MNKKDHAMPRHDRHKPSALKTSHLARTCVILGLTLGAGLPLPSWAQSSPDEGASRPQASPRIADGSATRAWLKAQDSGAMASKHRQTLSGPAMSRVHERYLNSFPTEPAGHQAGAGGTSTGAGSGTAKP